MEVYVGEPGPHPGEGKKGGGRERKGRGEVIIVSWER